MTSPSAHAAKSSRASMRVRVHNTETSFTRASQDFRLMCRACRLHWSIGL